MNTYTYQADLYCEDCIESLVQSIPKPEYEPPYDTDDYPALVLNDEADHPCYCGKCGKYLENMLTAEGYTYVREQYVHCIVDGAWGIYIPCRFSESFPDLLTKEQINSLSSPENQDYWDTWEEVTNEVVITKLDYQDRPTQRFRLYQDADLFAVRIDLPEPLQSQVWDSLS